MARPIVLASASPRRRELLSAAGFAFTIDKPEVDESVDPALAPEAAALEIALRKARAVALRTRDRRALVIAADTIVAVEHPAQSARAGQIEMLGKPLDDDDERRMLRSLSGSRHQVITGVCVLRVEDGRVAQGFERTWVTMRTIEEREVEAYVASGEWRDKAGGYAIQESADRFVMRLEEGGFDNVVGLPVELTRRLCADLE